MKRLLSQAALIITLLLGFGGVAEAELLTTNPHPSKFELTLGPAFGLANATLGFDIHANYLYHFSGEGSGFALGPDLDVLATGGAGAVVTAGARAVYDYEASQGIYLSPFGRGGASFSTGAGVGFNTQLGLGVNFVLQELWVVAIQPVGVEFIAFNSGVSVGYNLLFGAGIVL